MYCRKDALPESKCYEYPTYYLIRNRLNHIPYHPTTVHGARQWNVEYREGPRLYKSEEEALKGLLYLSTDLQYINDEYIVSEEHRSSTDDFEIVAVTLQFVQDVWNGSNHPTDEQHDIRVKYEEHQRKLANNELTQEEIEEFNLWYYGDQQDYDLFDGYDV